MIVVPTATPVTVPLSEPTVAAAALLLIHTPPPMESLKVVVSFAHTADGPIMAVGERLTVIVVLALQPANDVYVITVVPVATPKTLPAKTVATVVTELTHVPPIGLSLSVIIAPTHSAVGPVMIGIGFTVTIAVLAQPVGNVYEMTAVPGNAPLTMPDVGMTAAILPAPEVHKPPVVASISVVVAPAHTDNVPAVIVAGRALTVTVT